MYKIHPRILYIFRIFSVFCFRERIRGVFWGVFWGLRGNTEKIRKMYKIRGFLYIFRIFSVFCFRERIRGVFWGVFWGEVHLVLVFPVFLKRRLVAAPLTLTQGTLKQPNGGTRAPVTNDLVLTGGLAIGNELVSKVIKRAPNSVTVILVTQKGLNLIFRALRALNLRP